MKVLSEIARHLLLPTAMALALVFPAMAQEDPLPSWNEGPRKAAIIDFVKAVTDKDGGEYVPPSARIATFDNDGTLWVEHPVYTEIVFALDRVRALAPQHPEWKTTEPFKSILEGNMEGIRNIGMDGIKEIIAVTHAGMSTAEFEKIVTAWIAEARHPRFKRPYTELVYQPMLEVIRYLQDNDFKTYIVSGGTVEFMRPWTGKVYNIPPEQVVGTAIKTEFRLVDGKPELLRLADLEFLNDFGGKPVGINSHIGLRPIASFGNSTGDQQMLEWTAAGDDRRLMMLVLHDDPVREYAYGPADGLPDTRVGTFTQALLDQANNSGWNVIHMKDDWKTIFPKE
ncbi:HAD family hydrolase [Xanthobacter sp. TB0136]|uniref:HAD family hydrolase n=1 Tax=Xanthobacter sp. TB0136 TaxID=3459177 RepID=UPI004039A496